MQHRRWHWGLAVALTAAISHVPPAAAGDQLVDALSGTVLLSDGTPAPAAAVDLLLRTRAVERVVTQEDGRFTIDLDEDDVTLSGLSAGDTEEVYLRVSKLVPAHGGGTDLLQVVQRTVAYVEQVAGEADLRVHFQPLPTDKLVPVVVDTAYAAASKAAIFTDPDLVLGYEDLNDPDVIPPLGVVVDQVELPMLPATDVTNVDGLLINENEAPIRRSGCDISGSYWYPRPGARQPTNGIKQETFVGIYNCAKNEDDEYKDYWIIGMDGTASSHDVEDAHLLAIWRYKLRIQLTPSAEEVKNGGYWFMHTSPEQNYDNGNSDHPPIPWSVSFSKTGGVTGTVGGEFKPNFLWPSKYHQWREDAQHSKTNLKRLWHGSWLAKNQYGHAGGPRGSAGGMAFVVPQGTKFATVVGHTRRSVYVFRCWVDEKNDRRCDDRNRV